MEMEQHLRKHMLGYWAARLTRTLSSWRFSQRPNTLPHGGDKKNIPAVFHSESPEMAFSEMLDTKKYMFY